MGVSSSESAANIKKLNQLGITEDMARTKGGELGINISSRFNPEETRRISEAFAPPTQAPSTPSIGAPPQTPAGPTQLQKLQSSYLETLSPGAEELGAEKNLKDLVHSRELGIFGAGQQPIETGFVTGQQKAITDRARIQAMPLEAQLASLQAKRQTAADVLKTSLGFEEGKLERSEDKRRFEKEFGFAEQKYERSLYESDRDFDFGVLESNREFGLSKSKFSQAQKEFQQKYNLSAAEFKLSTEKFKDNSTQFGEELAYKYTLASIDAQQTGDTNYMKYLQEAQKQAQMVKDQKQTRDEAARALERLYPGGGNIIYDEFLPDFSEDR